MNLIREVNDMDINTLQAFISDVVSEVTQKNKESQIEMQKNPNDAFICGRALAIEEITELVQARMKIYDIEKEHNND